MGQFVKELSLSTVDDFFGFCDQFSPALDQFAAEVRQYLRGGSDSIEAMEIADDFFVGLDDIKKFIADFKKVVEGLEAECEMVSLETLFHSLIRFGRTLSPAISVQTNAEEQPYFAVRANYSDMERLFENLIKNSHDAGAKNIQIDLCPAEDSNASPGQAWPRENEFQAPPKEGSISQPTVQILFQDNGSGIDPEAVNKIFEKGFSTKGEHRGRGLSTVLEILKHYGGKIEVVESSPEGTRFMITLPVIAVLE